MEDSIENTNQFGTVDFVVFIGMFVIATLIGIYYAYKDRKKEDTDNYFFGGAELSPITLGLSIAVTFISAITIIGFPTHTYLYGLVIIWYPVASSVSKSVACFYYIPLIHRLKLVSIFEYLELRFNGLTRRIASATAILSTTFYMATCMYMPALALSAVTPVSLNLSIALTGCVCTFYTTLGGMKAVVWTDAFQSMVMFFGQVVAFGMGLYLIGGFGQLWEGMERSNRMNMFDFTFDMTRKYTFWSTCVALSISFTSTACINQSISQRYLSCKNVRDARIACVSAAVPTLIIMGISILTGGVMYVYYEGCDPLDSNRVEKPDQLLPYMVVEIFRDVPGMAGLFVSAAFSGTLSTVSSGINSLAIVVVEDYVKPIVKGELSEARKIRLSKLLVLALGIINTSFAFLIAQIESTVIEIGFAIFGSISGPVLGVYTLGIFFPWTTSLGALTAQLLTTAFCSWISISTFIIDDIPHSPSDVIPPSIENCTYANASSVYDVTQRPEITTALADQHQPTDLESTLFAISYLYYGTISCFTVITLGLILSFLTGANDPRDAKPELFMALVDLPFLPSSVNKFFRFGVPPLPRDWGNSSIKKSSSEGSYAEDEEKDVRDSLL